MHLMGNMTFNSQLPCGGVLPCKDVSSYVLLVVNNTSALYKEVTVPIYKIIHLAHKNNNNNYI